MTDRQLRGEDSTATGDALRRAERHLNLVLELADITAARVDTDLEHTWVHDANPDGVSEADALGKRDDELFPPEIAEPTLELKRAVLETGEPITRTVTFQKSDRDHVYRIRAKPMWDADGAIEGVMQAAVDVSEERRREQQLQVATRMLRHNLRNRVTTLLGQAELLDDHLTTLPESGQLARLQTLLETLQRDIRAGDSDAIAETDIEHELAEARQLASDLSEFSDANVSDMSRTIRQVTDRLYELTEKVDRFLVVSDTNTYYDLSAETDLREVLAAVRDEVSQTYPDAKITLDGDIGATVLAPSNELRIGVLELVENAVVHNDRADPTVEIRTREQDGGRVLVQIADDGPGLPAHEARVIEETTESPLEHGSGIGLWLAQWVSHKHGGPLRVDATEAGGTVVSLTLATADD